MVTGFHQTERHDRRRSSKPYGGLWRRRTAVAAELRQCSELQRVPEKAADFVEFCDAFEIPVLSLTNVAGFKACKCILRERIAKAAAKLTYAFANATVPKVNVITGKAFGSAYAAMNSKAIGADMTFAWENAQIGMMDAKLAAKIMYEGSDMH